MTKELQEMLIKKVETNAIKNIWTQKPRGTVLLSSCDRIDAFEQSHPSFVCYQRRGNGYDRYIDSHNEQLWQTVSVTESLRGYRFNHVIMDSEIDDESYWNLVPCFAQCVSIEFFE